MKKLKWLVISLSLLILPMSGYADTASGMVVEIVGQRVTIINDKAKEITFTIKNSSSLQVGDEVQIEYSKVGDARLATAVRKIKP